MPYKDRTKQLNAQKQHYQDNKSKYSIRFKKRKQARQEYLKNLKLELGCYLCGYNKCSRALVFHHLYGKDDTLTNAVKNGWAYKRIDNELSKCVILCQNCHCEVHDRSIDLVTLNSISECNTFKTWNKRND
jgi:hypothetical protein